ncbi:MAG: hypothetical protein A2Y38_08130 [Spirochaetes bacterium GWB1_59_5]|nr:MAG: hypothetical protein A2Y38_08130 [Spirochaetes bacterium GWB1_59_5]
MAEQERDTVRIHADEIIDGVAHKRCPGPCGRLLPLDHFGIRRMAGQGPAGTDLLTDQSWCRECR